MTASARIPVPAARGNLEDLRRRASLRLADRIDFAKTKHKPISLVRAEAKRVIEQFLDVEAPTMPAADREKVVWDVIGESVGLGPLEELFRDESVAEFMTLGPNLVIARKGTAWLPTSVRFADAGHYARTLAKLAEQGEKTYPGPQPTGGLDVKLSNGFRVTAVLPPAVIEHPPAAVFLRCPLPTKSGTVPTPTARPVPKDQSGTISFNATLSPAAGGSNTDRMSGSISASGAQRTTDPLERLLERTRLRMIERLAAAGIYDISAVPTEELQKVIAVQVAETAVAEKIPVDPPTLDRLTLEILDGMHR